MQTVNQCNSLLNLALEYHLSDLYPLIQRVQINAWLDPRFQAEFLCSLLKTLWKKKYKSEGTGFSEQ